MTKSGLKIICIVLLWVLGRTQNLLMAPPQQHSSNCAPMLKCYACSLIQNCTVYFNLLGLIVCIAYFTQKVNLASEAQCIITNCHVFFPQKCIHHSSISAADLHSISHFLPTLYWFPDHHGHL